MTAINFPTPNPEVKMLDDLTLVRRLEGRAAFFASGNVTGSNHTKSSQLYLEAARRIEELEQKLAAQGFECSPSIYPSPLFFYSSCS